MVYKYTYPLSLLIVLMSFSTCHIERLSHQERIAENTQKRKTKHFLFYSGKGKKELAFPDASRTDDTNKRGKLLNNQDLLKLNLLTFPRNFAGFITVSSKEENFSANIFTDISYDRNNNLVFKGHLSSYNKNSFAPIELEIPYYLFDNFGYNVENNAIYLEPNFKIFRTDSTDSDIRLDSTQQSDSLSITLENIYVSSIRELENTPIESIYSGQITFNSDKTITFYSHSDPLPLIPIIIAAVATTGISYLKDKYYDPWQEERKQKLTVKVNEKPEEKKEEKK